MAHSLPVVSPSVEDTPFHRRGRWWQPQGERILCELCPRACVLKPGDRGFCFVRQNIDNQMVLTTYGRSTGFCIDPIEKKPLNHFYPGTSVLSFGTAGCNLGCKFCQNWSISKSRQVEQLSERAFPDDIARAAQQLGCHSVAYTYNDPIIWAEYAIETAKACRAVGVKSVAVTAGYITEEARGEFFHAMDAANVDLKAFSEEFYHKLTLSHIQPVLDTLRWLKHETDVWFEITNLIIPDANDSADELKQMSDWILDAVGDDVPVHFTAFHPDFRMTDRPRTPAETLIAARDCASRVGIKHAYTGNVDDVTRQSTYCPNCSEVVIERNWYALGIYKLNGNNCAHCGTHISGHFADQPGQWGRKRQQVDMRAFADAPPRKETIMPTTTATPIEMTKQQQTTLLTAAAEYVIATVHGRIPDEAKIHLGELAQHSVSGVYVSLKRCGKLRGCCGMFGRTQELSTALQDSAYRTASSDPRFPPVSNAELPYLDMDVWLLYAPSQVDAVGEERVAAIQVGRDGLHIRRDAQAGLLLPGVAVDHEWNEREFLNHVCKKAQLPPSAWKDDSTQLMRFEGHVYQQPLADSLDGGSQTTPLYTSEQMQEYVSFCHEVLTSLVSGMMPTRFYANVQDYNVQGATLTATDKQTQATLKASRLAVRGRLPLQSTLYTLCEELANALRAQNSSSDLHIDIAILYDAAMHGTVSDADLRGCPATERAIVVAERNKTAWSFDTQRNISDVLQHAAELAQVNDPTTASVMSFRILSTTDALHVQSVPRPVTGTDARPPAVAGKFYPGEADKMSALLDAMLGEECARQTYAAVMVPHAGWRYSGKIAADVLKRVAFPKTVIAIGPKHTPHGVDWAVAPQRTWSLPGMTVSSDVDLAKRLANDIPGLQLDAAAHQQEHGIEVELPIIARLAPETNVIGIALSGGNLQRCDAFAKALANVIKTLGEQPLLLISSDMNHYANDSETRRLDEMALAELDKLDAVGLYQTTTENHISMCGMIPAVIVLKTLKHLDKLNSAERIGYATSANVSGDTSRVVGYAGMVFA